MKKNIVKFVNSTIFQTISTSVIVFAGILVGLETNSDLARKYHFLFRTLDQIILSVFIAEIGLKVYAQMNSPWDYFKDRWNLMDFSIVTMCLLPIGANYLSVVRLVRILRVFRLINQFPKLQILVGALLKSLPSMGHIGLLKLILFYIYAVLGTFLFGSNDPQHFGNLGKSFITLFRVITLEDWTDVMYTQMYGCNLYAGGNILPCSMPQAFPILSPAFFISFVILGTMIMLNLFIGVVLTGMEESQKEASLSNNPNESVPIFGQIDRLYQQIDLLKEQIGNLQSTVLESQKGHYYLPKDKHNGQDDIKKI